MLNRGDLLFSPASEVLGINTFISDIFGTNTSNLIILLLFTLVIVIYSVLIFYFYKFLAKKNIISLNLNQYNKTENLFFTKLFAFVFYIIEYIIILPVVTIFWFAIFSILLLIMAKTMTIATIMLISAALIASVRITSYINQNISQEIAKIVPFTLLALALTQPEFFNFNLLIERITQIPSVLINIPYYLLFIIVLELILRAGNLIKSFINIEKEPN